MLPCFVTWEHLPQRSSTPQGLPRSTWVIWHACVFVGQLCCWQNEVVSRTSWLLAHSARQRSGAALLASATMGRARFCQWNFAVCSSAGLLERRGQTNRYRPNTLWSEAAWKHSRLAGERKKEKKKLRVYISFPSSQTRRAKRQQTTNNTQRWNKGGAKWNISAFGQSVCAISYYPFIALCMYNWIINRMLVWPKALNDNLV